MDIQFKYFNLVIPTNDFKTQSPAFRSRLLVFDYVHSNKDTKNEEILVFLEDHMKYLGKHIYNKFKSLDIKSMFTTIKKRYPNDSKRDFDKVVYIKLGEMILNELGILTDVEINAEKIMNKAYERESSIKTDLMDIIQDRINTIYRDKDLVKNYQSIIDGYDPETKQNSRFDESAFIYFKSMGIYFGYAFKCICIGHEIKPFINKELIKRGYSKSYSTLKSIAEDLELPFEENETPENIMTALSDGRVIRASARCLKLPFTAKGYVQ
jgi:hypothetical protein